MSRGDIRRHTSMYTISLNIDNPPNGVATGTSTLLLYLHRCLVMHSYTNSFKTLQHGNYGEGGEGVGVCGCVRDGAGEEWSEYADENAN